MQNVFLLVEVLMEVSPYLCILQLIASIMYVLACMDPLEENLSIIIK